MKKNIILNYGILASMTWNSNHWAGHSSEEDKKNSNYGYLKEGNDNPHENLNFGHEIFPAEDDGYYIGYVPKAMPDSENSKNVQILFLISTDYKNNNRKVIVGFYGFPTFGSWERQVEHELYKTYIWGNITAEPEYIIYFKNPIVVTNEIAERNNLLPKEKKISSQGFNYLNSDNVYNLIQIALKLNPEDKKLKNFVEEFPLIEEHTKEKFDVRDFINIVANTTADTLSDIQQLEKKMQKQQSEIKQRISSFIERGAISNKVKKLNNYKCSVCEAFGQQTNSFTKSNSETYIETHHVEPVSSMKLGVLSATNLMTVCANHHRQMHYGNVELIENMDNHFVFNIDAQQVKIKKIIIA